MQKVIFSLCQFRRGDGPGQGSGRSREVDVTPCPVSPPCPPSSCTHHAPYLPIRHPIPASSPLPVCALSPPTCLHPCHPLYTNPSPHCPNPLPCTHPVPPAPPPVPPPLSHIWPNTSLSHLHPVPSPALYPLCPPVPIAVTSLPSPPHFPSSWTVGLKEECSAAVGTQEDCLLLRRQSHKLRCKTVSYYPSHSLSLCIVFLCAWQCNWLFK